MKLILIILLLASCTKKTPVEQEVKPVDISKVIKADTTTN